MGCGHSSHREARKTVSREGWTSAASKKPAFPLEEEAPRGEIKAAAPPSEQQQTQPVPRPSSGRVRRLSQTVLEDGAVFSTQARTLNGTRGTIDLPKPDARARRLSNLTQEEQLEQEFAEQNGADDILPLRVDRRQSGEPASISCSVACVSKPGREPGFKKQNQDTCFAFEKYTSDDQLLFGCFDGHGPSGHLVSGYVKQHLPLMLVNHLMRQPSPADALAKGFLDVDRALNASRIDCEFSGCTAVVAFLKGSMLTTAWVGDSRAVVGRQTSGGMVAVSLTWDHKPTTPEEQARILAASGRVERLVDETGKPIGPHRVWLQHAWIPGLAMSRALGDALAHEAGVSSVPESTALQLTAEDRFLILATDGVWEFIDNQTAVEIVGRGRTVDEGCQHLVDEAYERWLVEEEGVVDDITAVVVQLIPAA